MAWGTFDIDDAVYDNKVFDAGDNGAWSSFFNQDGTKMYLGARSGSSQNIKQYTLSTPWDVTTATYTNKNLGISSANIPRGIFFSPDGTKFYTVWEPNYIMEYTLSTAWDISTASYVRNSGQIYYAPVYIRSDGELAFTIGLVSSQYRVYEKPMSTAWNVSTLSTGDNYSIGASSIEPAGLFFNDAGTKMYIILGNTDIVKQYTLSTAWDITTANADGISFSIATQTTAPQSLTFNNSNGSKFYVCDSRYVYQYTTYNPSFLKSVNGLSYSSVKSWNGLAKASIKSINGLS